jgi:hypothetical protein
MVDRLYAKKLKLCQVAVPILFSAAMIVGWRLFVDSQSSGVGVLAGGFLGRSSIRLFAFAPHLWYDSFKFLAEQGFVLWTGPALVHTFLNAPSHKGSLDTSRQLFVPFFVIIWMLWYVIASIGWQRYAYPGWAVSSILVAKFLCDLVGELKIERSVAFALSQWGQLLPKLRTLPVLLLALIMIAWPAQNTVRRVVKGDNHAAEAFAHYIKTGIPTDALIASVEWEIDFLTDRTYLHIPQQFVEAHIKHYQLGYPLEGERYDVAAYAPDYVIDGPYNKGTGFISPEFVEGRCELVTSIGEYDLYKVTK